MGIFDWLSMSKKGVVPSSSKSNRITVEKALDFSKTYEELKPFFALFIYYFKTLLDSEEKIATKLKEVQLRTKQNLIEEKLLKELRALRYAFLHVWFFNLRPPKNQVALDDELLTIHSALKSVLKDRSKMDDLPLFKEGLVGYSNSNELSFKKLQYFKDNFPEKMTEKITRVAFDSTEGRLAGELHDFVIELFMTTIAEDKKILQLDNDAATTQEKEGIKNIIEELKTTRERAAKEFFEDLSSAK